MIAKRVRNAIERPKPGGCRLWLHENLYSKTPHITPPRLDHDLGPNCEESGLSASLRRGFRGAKVSIHRARAC